MAVPARAPLDPPRQAEGLPLGVCFAFRTNPLHQLMLQGGSPAEAAHFWITFWGPLWSPFSMLLHHLFERGFRHFPEAISIY